MAAPTTRYARSGAVHLAYQVIGDGPRDVVLSLDWASHLEVLWEQPFVQELLGSLARYSRVLWFDMRGVGLSDALVSPAAPEDWMDDVAAVMDAAGSGIEFDDRGQFALKGVSDPWELYATSS